jgi:hypothetical protein
MDGLKLSTNKLDLAAPDRGDRTTRVIFIRFRGPQALKDRWEKAGLQRDAIRSQCSTCSRHKKGDRR